MATEDAVKTLKTHKRWINGKGKKYMPSDMPVGISDISEAIDLACNHLTRRISPAEFIALYDMAVARGAATDAERAALKSARKVIRYLHKKGL